jgi:acyl-homoserine-lactone acylase
LALAVQDAEVASARRRKLDEQRGISLNSTIRTNCKSLLKGLLGAAALLAASAAAAAQYEATITRTTFGIPHIKAQDFGGLGFGVAYAEAQDNICLMADAYVSAAGKRSYFFGADGEGLLGLWPAKNVDSDLFYRSIPDITQLRAIFAQQSPEYRALIDGWVAGYNRFVKDHKDKLPTQCAGQAWVRAITRDVVLQSLNAFSMLLSSVSVGPRIVNAAPPTDKVARREAFPAKVGDIPWSATFGSNGWAFGRDAVVGGTGLVVGNPHFPWNGPNRFYEMHLTIPGKLDVAGAAIINQPYVAIGFTKNVAWTHTVDTAAHMTLFKLTLDPSDPTAYLVDGQREAMVRRQVTVENKDGAPIVRTIYSTRFGPVISIPDSDYAWTRKTAYAVGDADNGNLRGGDGWLGIARARTVRDIREALAHHLGAPFINTMAADRNGEALYADISAAPNVSAELFASCGTLTERSGQVQRFYVLDGSRSTCNWESAPGMPARSLLPAAQMVTLYRHDFVQNSNDSYRWTNPAAGMGEMGPMLGKDPGALPDLRTRSALQEINRVLKSEKFDINLAQQTILSNRNFAAQLVLPAVLELCRRPTAPADACAALAKWDGEMQLDSKSAMLFNTFWGRLSAHPDIWSVPFDPNDIVNTPRTLAVEGPAGEAALNDLKAAGEALKKMGIALDAPLGQIQFAQRGEERIPISGGPIGGVLNVMITRPIPGGFEPFHGTSYLQVVSFDAKGPVVNAVLSYSQSTDPASPYYADQTREFSKRKLHRYPFSADEIAADTVGQALTLRE